MRLKQLSEGVTFGHKQKQEILSDPNLKIGIEYEFYTDLVDKSVPSLSIEEAVIQVVNGELPFEALANNETIHGKPIFHYLPEQQSKMFVIYPDDDDVYYVYSREEHGKLTDYSLWDLVQTFFDEKTFNIIDGVAELGQQKYDSDIEGQTELVEDICEILRDSGSNVRYAGVKNLQSLALFIGHSFLSMSLELVYNCGRMIVAKDNEIKIDEKLLQRLGIADETFAVFMHDALGDITDTLTNSVDPERATLQLSGYTPEFNKDEVSLEPVERILMAHEIPYGRVELDFNGEESPIEVVTNIMSLSTGIKHMQSMFGLMSDELGASTDKTTGMHVSLSYKLGSETKDPSKRSVMINKFIALIAAKRIDNLFPERMHTSQLYADILTKIFDRLIINLDDHALSLKDASYHVFDEIISGEYGLISNVIKNQSINVRELINSENSGRVELRYFGGNASGEDNIPYESREDTLVHEILRAAYLLRVAHSKEYDVEYKKALYKLMTPVITDYNEIDRLYASGDKSAAVDILKKYKSTSTKRKILLYFEEKYSKEP